MIAILVVLLTSITSGNSMVPRIYAQSSIRTTTGCIHGSIVGLACVNNLGTHHLPKGKWLADVDGVNATLSITSIDKMGKISGILAGGNASCAIGEKPCSIDGSFNDKTGRISFLAGSTYHPKPGAGIFVSPVQNYTGIESQKISDGDKIDYQIHGTGKMIKPHVGEEFGWSATKHCVAMGCIG